MKSLSPWFQTAHLLNGIRKTVSEIEAAKASTEERRASRSERKSRQPNDRPQSRG
jgi:hypothetical protein